MSTSSERSSTKAESRDHNQGRQNRDYTPAQMAAVNRVRKCRVTDYYAILDIESPSSEAEIRKAYRKLALIMHPDKNGAPGADEAFKMVSKAFQVLSDSDKKRIFDQTGADPDSRGGGGMGSFARGAGGPGMQFGGGGDISPEDLFNMFFGGGGGGPFQAQFGGFGGPGIRVHTFGGGSPFSAFGNAAGAQRRRAAAPAEDFSVRNLVQMLPLLLLFGLPWLLSLFGDSPGAGGVPSFRFNQRPPFMEERHTSRYSISYFVNPQDVQNLADRKLAQLDRQAEVSYIQSMRRQCNTEVEYKQQKMSDARGWFFVDEEAYDAARKIPLPSCEFLDGLGITHERVL
uniref:ARAD1B21340p n=1 Tax=Blastobotrys adeninivorans TaxID=409370 RepID=A0A060TD40_BLAAD